MAKLIHDTLKSVAAEPPNFNPVQVQLAVNEQFGLYGKLDPLVSERDQNFRLRASDGRNYVVKITSLAEDPLVTDFQIAVLLHLEKTRTSGVPRIIRTLSGFDSGSMQPDAGGSAVLRVVTWLDGQLLSNVDVTPEIATDFGRRLAALDIALADFSHDGDQQVMLWDIQRAAELRVLLDHIRDPGMQKLLQDVLDTFEEHVQPIIPSLPRQVIHNDANSENVLLDSSGRVSGIIDFGDMLRAPRVVDVSTAAAYLRSDDEDSLHLIAPFVTGYGQCSELVEAELDVLYDLIRTRLAMTLIILYWRLSAREAGDPYREKTRRSEASAYGFLHRLSVLGRVAFRARFSAN